MNKKDMSKTIEHLLDNLKDGCSLELIKNGDLISLGAKNDKNLIVGHQFEQWVIERFLKSADCSLMEWRSDKSISTNGHTYRPSSSSNPDIVFSIQQNRVSFRFAVECKYRTKASGVIVKDANMQRYRNYMTETNQPVFLVLGIGGTPENPDCVYAVPLQDISKSEVRAADLKHFKTLSKKSTWRFTLDKTTIIENNNAIEK